MLDVKINMYPTHAASKPVAMIPNCAATRHAHFVMDGSGPVYLDPPSLDLWPNVHWAPDYNKSKRVDLNALTPAEVAAEVVRAAGGVAVIAHPFAVSRGHRHEERLIEEMAAAGMAGIEVDHRDHDEADRRRLRELAAGLGLLVTGSSDYHGTGKHNRLAEHTTEPKVLEAIRGLVGG